MGTIGRCPSAHRRGEDR